MAASERWAEETARIIVESRSLYARAHGEPFFYSSGWASPLYIDCKKLISSPADRNTLVEMMIEKLSDSLDLDALEVVAGWYSLCDAGRRPTFQTTGSRASAKQRIWSARSFRRGIRAGGEGAVDR